MEKNDFNSYKAFIDGDGGSNEGMASFVLASKAADKFTANLTNKKSLNSKPCKYQNE